MPRKLNLKEQCKLIVEMNLLHLTQTKIAKINGLKSSMLFSKVCRGEYNVTPKVKQQFLNAGINLDEIME